MLLTFALLSSLSTGTVADSLPGSWQITGDVAGNPVNVTCTIKQAGPALSGSCTNEAGGPYPLTGEVREGKVAFQYGIDYQGQPLTIAYSGSLSSPRALKGTIEVKPMAITGTFTAVPAPAKP